MMNQETLSKELKIADTNAEISKERGINWAVISLGLIALIIFITALIFTLVPNSFFNMFEKDAVSPGTPVDQPAR